MKIVMKLVSFVIAFASVAMFTSCSDDDNNETIEEKEEGSIVGTWIHDESNEECVNYRIYTFEADGTGESYEYYDYNNTKIIDEETFVYTYNQSNGILRIYAGDEVEVKRVIIINPNTIIID
mgnify:CR=1 FL=1